LGYEDLLDYSDYGKVVFEIFDRHVQSKILDPIFITQHPRSISPLARPNLADARFVDRFELMIAGMEIAQCLQRA